MTLNSSVLILLTFVSLYLTIIEIFTMLFRLTGMTAEKARFQVISMLTNSGFTTAESETILSSRRRRSLATLTMLFGYTFTVVIVSTLLNVIIAMSTRNQENVIHSLAYLFIFAFALFLLKKIPFFHNNLNRLIRQIASHIMFSRDSNRFLILDVFGSNVLGEISITNLPEQLVNKTILELGVRFKHGISILTITRNGISNPNITPNDILQNGDRLVVFGSLDNIANLFECPITY